MEKQDQKSANEIRAEGRGKTLADAEAEALTRLEEVAGDFDRDEVELRILDEGSKGFLGMGSNEARVELVLAVDGSAAADTGEQQPAAPDADPAAAAAEARRRLADYLDRIIDAIGIDSTIEITEDEETLTGNVRGGDLGIFIGRHGQTIDAIQYLANVISFRGLDERKRVIIDAEDYRERRRDALHSLAERAVSELEQGTDEYELKPMSASERRIIHLYLQDRENVDTISEGRDPYRRVIITRVDD